MNKEDLKEKFKKYVFDNFDINDSNISRKYYHSLRVMDISEFIAKENNFSKEDIELSIIIGLLHDYARFKQWKDYGTYNDVKSFDHGDLGVELLFKNKEIENYNLRYDYYDEVYNAIKYHNKLDIIDDLSVHNKLLCKLIRDADKLDIFYLFGKDKDLFKQDDEDISLEIRECFFNNKKIDKRLVKSKNDLIILDLAFVFDLNFDSSYKYVRDNKLIEKMYDKIIDKNIFKEYFDYIYNFINERIG